MKKKHLLLLFVIFLNLFSMPSFSQTLNSKLELSNEQIGKLEHKIVVALSCLADYNNSGKLLQNKSIFVSHVNSLSRNIDISFDQKSDETTISILIKAQKGYLGDQTNMSEIFIHSTQDYSYLTCICNLAFITQLVKDKNVFTIEPSYKTQTQLNQSVYDMGASRVWVGDYGFDEKINGEGVIVGIIDTKINRDHVAFNDEIGQTRILNYDEIGSGGEVHGTHVGSIATGRGMEVGVNYRGVAYGSDILWKSGETTNEILNNFQWMIDQSGSTPLVVNLSAGFKLGPHDGSTEFETLLNSKISGNKFFVNSCGNYKSEDYKIHFQHEVPEDNTMSFTVWLDPDPLPDHAGEDYSNNEFDVEIWYGGEYALDIRVMEPDGEWSPWIDYGGAIVVDFTGDGMIFIQNDGTCYGPHSGYGNGDNVIYLQFYEGGILQNPIIKKGSYIIQLRDHDNNNPGACRIDAYNTLECTDYSDTTINAISFPGGDFYQSISSPSYASRVISVAACQKNNYGGDIASYSSVGPTRSDNSTPTKPNITTIGGDSPPDEGMVQAASYNDNSSLTMRMEGTSQAAPHVTGAIALLLQYFPDLTIEEIINILEISSDPLPNGHSYRNGTLIDEDKKYWGSGKLNILSAYKYMAGYISQSEYDQAFQDALQNHPYLKGLPVEKVNTNWFLHNKQKLTNGAIFLKANTSIAFWLGEEIWNAWNALGHIYSELGFPISSEYKDATNNYYETVNFQYGQIFWDGSNAVINTSTTCPVTITYGGKVYNTVQIGTQCWMKENLNIGTLINGNMEQTNNGYIEKYCYDNLESNCDVYGGLYQWNEMMGYMTTSGVQGICPEGWHLPTDPEWCTLEQEVDSTITCDSYGWRGVDGGGKLKEYGTTHWISPNTGATNSSGFTALPGGRSFTNGSFSYLSNNGYWWSSSQSNTSSTWSRFLHCNYANVYRNIDCIGLGFSVRCLKDETTTSQLEVTPSNQSVLPDAGTTTFEVTSNTSWTVSENSDWFTVTPDYGNQNVTLNVNYNANTTALTRIDEITITAAGGNPVVVVTITQQGQQTWACGQPITDNRDSQTYNTVQIGTQCWMKENLNIGTRINGNMEQTNNGVIEKYCYDNLESNCDVFGGLYQWNEMMGYITTSGVQGICPESWHLPTDADWTVLTSYLSSQPEYYCNSNNTYIAKALAATTDWVTNGGTCVVGNNLATNNATGFTALPGGIRHPNGVFNNQNSLVYWWSSSHYDASHAWFQGMLCNNAQVYRNNNWGKWYGFSVTCLKNETTTSQLEVTPTNRCLTPDAGIITFEVTSNTFWTVSENADWATITPDNGNQNGTLSVDYDANTTASTRIGEIIITAAGGNPVMVVTITQQGEQQAWSCGQAITDSRDCKTYGTIQIGTQCWMQQNLNVGIMIEGINEQSNNGTIEKYCYENMERGCDVYGGLYQWDEAMQYNAQQGLQGICPEGWHLPEDAEWCTLEQEVDPTISCSSTGLRGADGGGKLKETGTTHWSSPNTGATNSSGFTALPGGFRGTDGSFYYVGYCGDWWSSSQDVASNAWRRGLDFNRAQVVRNYVNKSYGFSVRCLKDEFTTSQLEVTPSNQNVAPVAGTSTFEVTSNTSWTVSENDDWFTVTPDNGNQNGTLNVNYDANTTASTRIGEITITAAGGNPVVEVTITQQGEQQAWACGQHIIDSRDGQTYNTVQIGEQCWMAENLAFLPLVSPFFEGSETAPFYYVYNYDGTDVNEAKASPNYQNYGVLYNWPASLTVCPVGWHLPSDAAWTQLIDYVVGQGYPNQWDDPNGAGNALKSCRQVNSPLGGSCNTFEHPRWEEDIWSGNNQFGFDEFGFSCLPGGLRGSWGDFLYIGTDCNFFSSTEYATETWGRSLNNTTADIIRLNLNKGSGSSVRCLRDETTTSQLTITPVNQDVASDVGTTTFEVTSNSTWTVTENETWFSVSPMNGSNNGTLTVIYDANTSADTRVGQITVAANGGTPLVIVTVSQAGSTQQWSCGQNITDTRDGQIYTTVQIGDQCWMAENLAYLPEVSPSSQGSETDPYYYVYDYQGSDVNAAKATDNYNNFGALYNWMASLGACPEGWHLPSDTEWTTLTTFLGGESVAGGKMKETGTTHWWHPNTGATNESGFTALPGGARYYDGSFSTMGNLGNWWSSSQYFATYPLYRGLSYDATWAGRSYGGELYGFSVRCLKDFTSPSTYNLNLEVSPAGAGTVSGAGQYEAGGQVNLAATPNTGWEFVNWTDVDGIVSEAANFIYTMPAGDITLTANFFEEQTGFNCGNLLVDPRNNQTYTTVQIGDQCWMAENLAYLPEVSPSSQGSDTDPYYYVYDYQGTDVNVAKASDNYNNYGTLYNWPASLCACPAGWHLPTDAEWTTITTFLGGESVAGGKMKETGTTHWWHPNTGATNESGFTALPGGQRRVFDGTFFGIGFTGFWLSSTEYSSGSVWYRHLDNYYASVNRDNFFGKADGFSVRCLKDENTTSQVEVTPANQNVTADAGTTTFELTSSTTWSVEEDVSWLSVIPMNGSNNATLTVTYEENAYGVQREGIISASGTGMSEPVTFMVIQEAQLFTPTLELGPDVTVCENTSGFSPGALMNFEQVCDWNGWDQMWWGDGTINPIFPICCPWEAMYHPGPGDLSNGSVTCYLEILCCENGIYQWVSDSKTFYFQNLPIVVAGSDKIISSCEQITLDASASGSSYLSYSWQPSAFLDNPTLLNPTFGNAPAGTYLLTLDVTDDLGCTSSDQLEIIVIPDQSLSLNNGWSGISSYFLPQDPDIVNLMNTVSQNLTIFYNLSGTIYFPQFGIFPSQPWNVHSGYIIKMSADNQIEICGSIPENCTLNLNSGWNLIPVLNNESLSTSVIFEPISQVQIVKEVAGNRLYWKQYNINTLETIEPGKAYFVRMSSSGTLSFPPFNFYGAKNMTIENSNSEESSPWGLVHKTPSSHIIAIPANITNQINDQSFVGAFTIEGTCAGYCSVSKDQNQVLVVNLDDPLTSEKDGFIDDEPLSFRIWDVSTDKVWPLQVEFDIEQPDYSGTFVTNGISSIIKMQINNNIQGNSLSNIQIFPNPSHDYINIFGIVDGKNIRFTLFTLSGQELQSKELNSNGQINMSNIPAGIYFIRIEDGHSVRHEKMVLE